MASDIPDSSRSAEHFSQDSSPFEVALEHSVRWWTAEEENARRLTSRERLFVTVGLALAGLSGGKAVNAVGEVLGVHPTPLQPSFWFIALLAVGILLLLWGVFYAAGGLRRGKRSRLPPARNATDGVVVGLASQHLGLNEATLEALKNTPVVESSAEDYRATVFFSTVRAADMLTRFNEEKRQRIDHAQRIFGAGLLVVLLSAGIYAAIQPSVPRGADGYTRDVTVELGPGDSVSSSLARTHPREAKETQ